MGKNKNGDSLSVGSLSDISTEKTLGRVKERDQQRTTPPERSIIARRRCVFPVWALKSPARTFPHEPRPNSTKPISVKLRLGTLGSDDSDDWLGALLIRAFSSGAHLHQWVGQRRVRGASGLGSRRAPACHPDQQRLRAPHLGALSLVVQISNSAFQAAAQ